MSRENVAVVRAAFEAWNAGSMDALGELYDPDIILRGPRDWPEPGPWVGREAVIRQWQLQREAWESDELKLIAHTNDVGDRVVVRLIWRGVGSGPESKMEMTGVYTVRAGRISYMEFFWDHAEALETLGLLE
jgi:ketosteroid isomerase-like protein